MMFVRYFRSELMRSIKTKVCIVLFVAYICVGIYSAWFSGCWMSSGSLTGLGFFPDPRWVDVRGGDTTVIAPLAHSMFFPAFVLLAIALLFQEPVYGSPSEVSVARGRLELEIPVARVLATTLIMQLFYVCFSVLYALCMPIFEGSGIPFSLWHQFATRLGLGVLLGSSYCIVASSIVAVCGAGEIVLGALLVVSYAGQLLTFYTGRVVPTHISYFMAACGQAPIAEYSADIVVFSVVSMLLGCALVTGFTFWHGFRE